MSKGRIEAGNSAKTKIDLGKHQVIAATVDGLDKVQQTADVKTAGQTAVSIELKPVRDARLKAEQEAREKADQGAKEKARRDQEEKERQEAERNVLTNQTIVDMVAGGLPQELILAKIRSSKTRFDLSAPGLMDLNKRGVPAEVVRVMIDPAAPPSTPADVKPQPLPFADPNDPASPHAPGIYLAMGAGADRKLIPLEARRFATKVKAEGVIAVGDGPEAKIKASNAQPEFYFYFPEGGAGQNPVSLGAAVSPSDFTFFRFTPNKEGMRDAPVLAILGIRRFVPPARDHISFKFSRVGPTSYKVTLPSPLTTGEYGFLHALSTDEGEILTSGSPKYTKYTSPLWIFDFGVRGAQ